MKSSPLAILSILLISLTGCSPKAQASVATYSTALDIPYRAALPATTHPQNAFTLDIYSRPGQTPRGVVVFIHGGGWMEGDKSNLQKNPKIAEFFIDEGFVVAAVNFRLPQWQSSPRVTYREQEEDIAAAIKWLTLNAKQYGGDPQHLVLFGYSSGAHLAALLSTDVHYLAAQGIGLNVIDGSILMDVHTYDIPATIASMRNTPIQGAIPKIKFLFGDTVAEQNAASPAFYLNKSNKIPFLIISSGAKGAEVPAQNVSNINSEAFTDLLKRNGNEATHVHFANRSHDSLALGFARPGDPVTAEVKKFLDGLKGAY